MLQLNGRRSGVNEMVAGDQAAVDADQGDGRGAGVDEVVAGDDEVGERRRAAGVGVGMHRDRRAARPGIHIGEGVVGDGEVAHHAALDVGEVAVDLDAAALPREDAAAHRAGAGLDQQPLVVVLEVAALDQPAGALVVGPLDDRVRETLHRPVHCRGAVGKRDECGGAEFCAGILVAEQQPVARRRVLRDRLSEFTRHLECHALSGAALDVAPVAVEVCDVVGGVADDEAVERRALARGVEHEPLAALPAARAGARPEVAVFPQVPAHAAALRAPALGDEDLEAVHRAVFAADEFYAARHRVDAREAVADLQCAEVAVGLLPLRVTDRVEQLGVAHGHEDAAGGGAGHDALILQVDSAALQGVERRAEPAVAFERQHPLLGLVVELRRHRDARRELQFDAVVRVIELGDAALDVAARPAVERRAAEDQVATVLEAAGEVRVRRLVVGQIEPERRIGGSDGERMRRVALEAGEFQRVVDAVAAPVFGAEAIVARRYPHHRRSVAVGGEHQRQNLIPGLALRLLLLVGELRPCGKREAEFRRGRRHHRRRQKLLLYRRQLGVRYAAERHYAQ